MKDPIHVIQEIAGAFEQHPSDEFSLIENGAIAGQYLARFWQPVALARDFKPGSAKRIKILGGYYTLYPSRGWRVQAGPGPLPAPWNEPRLRLGGG